MSFSEKTIRTLEFDKVCAMLADCAETEGACAMAQNLRPSADRVTVRRRLDRTTDARRLADAKGAPSFGKIRDISSACERAEKGAVLSMRCSRAFCLTGGWRSASRTPSSPRT